MKKIQKTIMKSFLLTLFVVMVLFLSIAATLPTSNSNNSFTGKSPKYIFLFIGDGMGIPQVASAEIYAAALKGGKYPDATRVLSFTQFPCQGITTTHDSSSFITDSASAGTAIACGYKTLNGVISMDPEKKIKYTSIAKQLKEKGLKIGIVSSVSIEHATPAVFYAKCSFKKHDV